MNKLGFLGFFIIISSLLFAQIYHGSSLKGLFDLPAFLIVFGGTLGAVLVQTSSKQLLHALTLLPEIFTSPSLSLTEQSKKIQEWSYKSRQHGLLSLEEENGENLDPFTQKGLAMLVDGCDQAVLQDILQQDIELDSEHHERSAQLFESMGGYSPTIGIIGAVLGLIHAMGYLDQPDKLGEGIAVAFIATIYGVGFANFIYLPIANKIRLYYQYVALYKEMTLIGLIAIAQGDNSLLLERRLNGYINRASY
ncbi:flagellar motor protein [Psychromonas antarctica]|jgi:chemotaxis protein MotA|uniref:flagellar motor protein n=1 Tax=Psychromonas antarctica TaxID=67573 RepID=UPI001EE7E821|nr:flagellar motor protein [Psychromonas antarctica]MCG6199823.1 flagellar motor protein [Psychromonas antarctica]